MAILEKINKPEDLQIIKKELLPELAQEIRDEIIQTVSRNGGHLASSLGTVELTIALHYVFNAPKDKIIWDVGHQAYPHKLLTGRHREFSTLRTHGGISAVSRGGKNRNTIRSRSAIHRRLFPRLWVMPLPGTLRKREQGHRGYRRRFHDRRPCF